MLEVVCEFPAPYDEDGAEGEPYELLALDAVDLDVNGLIEGAEDGEP